MKQISTTALSKSLGITSKELFAHLLELGLIAKDGQTWILTSDGEEKGGAYKESQQYGKYIVWPEDISIAIPQNTTNGDSTKLITATAIGRKFELSANKVNFILSELGWVNKGLKGWVVTDQGKKQGGVQAEDKKSGIPYVRWPESIIGSKLLNETVSHVKGTRSTQGTKAQNEKEDVGFRDKFEAKHRSADGHFVRSKAEMLIDNWLYMAEISRICEKAANRRRCLL